MKLIIIINESHCQKYQVVKYQVRPQHFCDEFKSQESDQLFLLPFQMEFFYNRVILFQICLSLLFSSPLSLSLSLSEFLSGERGVGAREVCLRVIK